METPADSEAAVRQRLGIPRDAERVLVFAESSHWDPDWMFTSEEYYRLRIRRVLDGMMRWLEREPRRVYSIECMYFFKMYWDRNPERREALRSWVNEGRIRFSGSGINTPDSILPELEAVIRDYLHGQEWLRSCGMEQEPRLAYLPDNFGNTPALPTVLEALGYEYSAFSRIDGIFFPGLDYFNAGKYPLSGSSAELLLREHRSADFVWRSEDGAEIICHLNPFTYGQGDTIAHAGVARWMGLVIGLPLPMRGPGHVAKKVAGYVRQLERYAKTPYMFCPIGFDFNQPIPYLAAMLDGYNQAAFAETGVYAVNAALEDYMDLIAAHREALPVLTMDPNPYFTGFYSSRPEMKQRCKDLAATLITAEKLLAVKEGAGGDEETVDGLWGDINRTWDEALMSNHHDFITGTSPNRVWEKEQKPLLIAWQAAADAILDRASSLHEEDTEPALPPAVPEWTLQEGVLTVRTAHFTISLDEAAGGCITRWTDPSGNTDLVIAPANDVAAYEDRGGLWRMGYEFKGGVFRERERISMRTAEISADEADGALEVTVEASLEGNRVVRRLWFRDDSPLVWMRLTGTADGHRTVVCRFPTRLNPEHLIMDVTGGVVRRPFTKLFYPTFWAAKSFAFIRDKEGGTGLAAFLGGPAAVSCDPDGVLEFVAMRNTRKEKAFYILPLLGNPAAGADYGEQHLDYAVCFTTAGDWYDNRLHKLAGHVLHTHWRDSRLTRLQMLGEGMCDVDNDDVSVLALKRALRGSGLIVRLYSPTPTGGEVSVALKDRKITEAVLCDARERDLAELRVADGKALVPCGGSIVTVRLSVA
jgi:hypothetical protein